MWVSLVLALLGTGEVAATSTRFTNIQCEVLDPTYCAYKKCELNVLGRGVVGLNIHAVLLTGFFDNAKVNLSLLRKYNGYRPFMFNKTIDFCDFMSKKRKTLSFEGIVIDIISQNSNVNHSCPYNHDLIFKNLVLMENYFRFFPAPTGEYKLQVMAATNNTWKTRVTATISRKEDILKN